MSNAIYFGSETNTANSNNTGFHAVGNNNSGGRSATVPNTCLTPDNGGYSYTILDDASRYVNAWQDNNLESSEAECQELALLAKKEVKDAVFSKRKKRYLGIIAKAQAVKGKNFHQTKVIVADSIKKQWDSVQQMFSGMDKIWAGYSIGQQRQQNSFQLTDERRLATIGKLQQQQSKQLSALSSKF